MCGSGYGTMGSIYGRRDLSWEWNVGQLTESYFSVESLEKWCSWQTATCRDIQEWIGWVFPQVGSAN